MSDLGPSAKALLEAARPALGPDMAAIARMRAAVDVAAGASAAAASTTIGASGAKIAAATSALGVGKVIVMSFVAIATTGALIVGGARLLRPPQAAPAPTRAPNDVVSNVVAVPTPAASVAAVSPPAPSSNQAPTPVVVAQHRVPANANHHAATNEHAAIAAAPETPPESSLAVVALPDVSELPLAREVELLDDASMALRNGSTTLALSMIDKYERATSAHGQLAEDAAAIKVEALCAEHDITTVAAIERRFPQIAHRARVRAACGAVGQ